MHLVIMLSILLSFDLLCILYYLPYCRRLMTELLAFKDTDTKATTVTSGGTADSNNATYQIYYRPEQAKFSNSARVSYIKEFN